MLTSTCRRNSKQATLPNTIPLGELFKHRPSFGGHLNVPACSPDSDGSGSNAASRIVGVSRKRTKRERFMSGVSLLEHGLHLVNFFSDDIREVEYEVTPNRR
jgi:hypothetical protein